MTVVGVTGSAGFFGWHLRCRLFTFGWEWVEADRSTFEDEHALDSFVAKADVVVHIAGVNRASSDAEILDGNVGLAEALVAARRRTGSSFDVVYANSVKAGEPGVYGESKAAAAELLGEDARAAGNRFANILFPHLFGEFGRPFYNSAVTTFAHQLVQGEESQVNDGQLELLHVQDAAQVVLDVIGERRDEPLRPHGQAVAVPEVFTLMRRLAEYAHTPTGVFPAIANQFELRLFNAIRSQMWPDAYPVRLTKHADDRGAFFEAVRAWGQGQTSISTTVPGVVRGEHYHLDKVERFVVISGDASIRVRRLLTDDVQEYSVSGSDPVVIDMPPLCAHDITNSGSSELVTLFWSHDHFDPANGDTYPLKVVGEGLPA